MAGGVGLVAAGMFGEWYASYSLEGAYFRRSVGVPVYAGVWDPGTNAWSSFAILDITLALTVALAIASLVLAVVGTRSARPAARVAGAAAALMAAAVVYRIAWPPDDLATVNVQISAVLSLAGLTMLAVGEVLLARAGPPPGWSRRGAPLLIAGGLALVGTLSLPWYISPADPSDPRAEEFAAHRRSAWQAMGAIDLAVAAGAVAAVALGVVVLRGMELSRRQLMAAGLGCAVVTALILARTTNAPDGLQGLGTVELENAYGPVPALGAALIVTAGVWCTRRREGPVWRA